MRSLYTEDVDERWTEEATAISARADRALRPIINDAITQGVSLRDLQLVLESTVLELVLCALLTPIAERRLLEY